MIKSPLENNKATIKTDKIAVLELNEFSIIGSTLEMDGYLSINELYSNTEAEIRKTLMLVPKIDIQKLRGENFEDELYQDLTDEEVIEMYTVYIPTDNCSYQSIKRHENSKITDLDSLGGFKLNVDLSFLKNGAPLRQGDYSVYLKLEQILSTNDSVKYVKVIPLSDIKNFLKDGMISAQLEYHSAKLSQKYNLIASFDNNYKTLKFQNTLLQSYNPEEFAADGDKKEDGRIVQAIKRRLFGMFYILFKTLPISKKKITFASDSRTDLNGNMYFLYEEIYNRKLHLKIQLLFSERIDDRKSLARLVNIAFQFATSKIIVLDDFYPLVYPLNIRKNTDLIQVWHAAGAFKTFGFSRVGRPGGPSAKSKNHRNYTKAIVSSEGVREHYAEGFGITMDKVYPTGIPRSDIFFDDDYKSHVEKSLYDKYPILKKKKVILFAPTFRGNGQNSAYYPFHVLNLKMLYEKLSDDYVFLFKIHPFVKNKLVIPGEYSDFFHDFSDFREINDLLLVTDILITDYSSVCFEYSLLEKPMLFFAFDVEEYLRTRDFYYNYFDFIPGPLVKTTESIISEIKNGEFDKEKNKEFVNYFFGDNLGNATKNLVDNVISPSLSDYEEEEIVVEKLVPPKSRIELFDRTLEKEEN